MAEVSMSCRNNPSMEMSELTELKGQPLHHSRLPVCLFLQLLQRYTADSETIDLKATHYTSASPQSRIFTMRRVHHPPSPHSPPPNIPS